MIRLYRWYPRLTQYGNVPVAAESIREAKRKIMAAVPTQFDRMSYHDEDEILERRCEHQKMERELLEDLMKEPKVFAEHVIWDIRYDY